MVDHDINTGKCPALSFLDQKLPLESLPVFRSKGLPCTSLSLLLTRLKQGFRSHYIPRPSSAVTDLHMRKVPVLVGLEVKQTDGSYHEAKLQISIHTLGKLEDLPVVAFVYLLGSVVGSVYWVSEGERSGEFLRPIVLVSVLTSHKAVEPPRDCRKRSQAPRSLTPPRHVFPRRISPSVPRGRQDSIFIAL